jgi:Transcription factor WhiB
MTDDDLASLFGALGGIPLLPGARCRGQHDLFDPRDVSDPDCGDIEAQALALCRQCPALAGCSAWFEALPAKRRPQGVIAGRVNQRRER